MVQTHACIWYISSYLPREGCVVVAQSLVQEVHDAVGHLARQLAVAGQLRSGGRHRGVNAARSGSRAQVEGVTAGDGEKEANKGG